IVSTQWPATGKPATGRPMKASRFFLYSVIVGLVLANALGQSGNRAVSQPAKNEPQPKAEPTPEQQADEARWRRDVLAIRQLRSNMKNPDSFKLEEALRMDDGTLCLTYRATNSFNAIVPGRAVIADNKISTSD